MIIPRKEDLKFHVICMTCFKEVIACCLQLLRKSMLFAWQRNNYIWKMPNGVVISTLLYTQVFRFQYYSNHNDGRK